MAAHSPIPYNDETPAEEQARLQGEAARLVGEIAHLNDLLGGTSQAVVPVGDGLDAQQVKRQLAETRSMIARKIGEVEAVRKALDASIRRQLDEMEAAIRPLRDKIALLEEGVAAVNLYLGVDERIHQIADGEPAGTDVALTVRQQVLFADEETAALAESGGIDFSALDVFDDWLVSDPAHLHQVLPEQKCVVVIRPRRSEKRYDDNPWVNEQVNRANRESHWLIRNGQRVYRMTTPLNVGLRLIPGQDEFTGLFRVRRHDVQPGEPEWEDLEPGSAAWVRAEKQRDARQRHYMQIALVLQGLVERTTVLHPLPGGKPLSLLHPEAYDDGRVVVVKDDEQALTTGRQPFYEWLAERNSKLRVGMRIVGAFGGTEFRQVNDNDGKYRAGHSRLWPAGAENPPSRVVHYLDGLKRVHGQTGYSFRYRRHDKVWARDKHGNETLREAKLQASCTILPDDRFVIPVDLVSVEEMRAYLDARTDRHAYATMMPLLHAAIAVKQAESDLERPFRQLIAGEIARTHGVDPEEAEEALPELVDWWKLANRWHRPLVAGDGGGRNGPEDDAKALRMIVAEYARRREASGGRPEDDTARQRLLSHDPEIMLIGRARSGGYVAFAPMGTAIAEAAVASKVWVREYRTGATTRSAIHTRDWIMPGNRASKTTVLHQSELWRTWNTSASTSDHFSGPELAALAEEARRKVAGNTKWAGREQLAVTFDRQNKTVEVWFDPAGGVPAAGKPSVGYDGFPEMMFVEMRVRRGGGGKLILGDPGWERQIYWRDLDVAPWDVAVWDGVSRNRAAVSVDQDAYARAQAGWAEVVAAAGRSAVLTQRVREALRTVETGWLEQAELAAHDRFVADYADPDLWEGHRKTLRFVLPARLSGILRFDGPPKRQVGPVVAAVAALVEAGVGYHGTVGGLLQRYAELTGTPAEAGDGLDDEILALTITVTGGNDATGSG